MKVKKIANGIKHFGINCRILTQSTSEKGREEGEAEAGGEGDRQRPEGREKKRKGS